MSDDPRPALGPPIRFSCPVHGYQFTFTWRGEAYVIAPCDVPGCGRELDSEVVGPGAER